MSSCLPVVKANNSARKSGNHSAAARHVHPINCGHDAPTTIPYSYSLLFSLVMLHTLSLNIIAGMQPHAETDF
jgi:hypothetical protein